MRVCIDVQPAVSQLAGIGRYVRFLVTSLASGIDEDALRLFYFDFKKSGIPFDVPGIDVRTARWCPGRLMQLAWKKLQWPPFDWMSGKADVFHFPNYIIPPLSEGKTIVGIHDLSFISLPECAEDKNREYLEARLADTVSRADAVIAHSESIANEISAELGVPRDRVTSIYHGIDPSFVEDEEGARRTAEELGLDRPYMLVVGTLEPRKNIPFAIELFEAMTEFDGHLVVVGMNGWKYEPILKRMQESSRAGDIRHVGYVRDGQLPGLYAGASLLLFPSLYEGFGFPPLEAMACGTPVISGSGGSLAEVLGDAAVVLDSFDKERWLCEARRLLSDDAVREKYKALGKEKAASYTWDKAAQETWALYRKLGR